jgi:hypothetical protein
MRSVLITMLLLVAAAANASTVTIDFEEFPVGAVENNEVQSQGFRVSGGSSSPEGLPAIETSTNFFGEAVITDDGQPVPQSGNVFSVGGWQELHSVEWASEPITSAIILLSRVDGESFSIYSAQAKSVHDGLWVHDIQIMASLANGSEIFGSMSDLGQGDWLNVQSVAFYDAEQCWQGCPQWVNFSVDNIVVGAAVPIPAAVWLFGSALAGLGLLRRLASRRVLSRQT